MTDIQKLRNAIQVRNALVPDHLEVDITERARSILVSHLGTCRRYYYNEAGEIVKVTEIGNRPKGKKI
jgi:hypothetical protein